MTKRKNLLVLFALLSLCAPLSLFAQQGRSGSGRSGSGSTVRGGADQVVIEESVLRMLLDPATNYLKLSLSNYFRTLNLTAVTDPTIRKIFPSPEALSDFQRDIQESPYVEGEREGCLDTLREHRSASTIFGDRGGEICFDVRKLAQELKGKRQDEIVIAMAALAAHEHRHHLQANPAGDSALIEQLEAEAYALSAYVTLTARVSQVPVLQWTVPEAPLSIPLTFEYQIDGEMLDTPPSAGSPQYVPMDLATIGSLTRNRPRLAAAIARSVAMNQAQNFAAIQQIIENAPIIRAIHNFLGGDLSIRLVTRMEFAPILSHYWGIPQLQILHNSQVIRSHPFVYFTGVSDEQYRAGWGRIFAGMIAPPLTSYLSERSPEFRRSRELCTRPGCR